MRHMQLDGVDGLTMLDHFDLHANLEVVLEMGRIYVS